MAIRILEEQLVNKIAAGEVVERPASVVKELVENALDAGARSLQVHLRGGGRNLVRIVDDGAGMDRTDAVMALERHATSKIRNEADLFAVGTLGFRGEAVPSIASVSKFEILTRRHDQDVGTRVRVEGGRLMEVEPAGCAPGTEISVASLFFNVPARRKFLRTVETELGHAVEAVTREALIRPDLDLEVTHDDRPLLRCPAGLGPRRRAADLLGPHGEALVPVAFSRGKLEVEALVSPVGVHRASPQGSSYLYVNGRFVKDMVLRRGVSAAYAGIVPKDRYPVVILQVRVPAEDVDVNVHPAKTEVRFQHAFELQDAIARGLRDALQGHGIQKPVAVEARYKPVVERVEQTVLPLRSGALFAEERRGEGIVAEPGSRATGGDDRVGVARGPAGAPVVERRKEEAEAQAVASARGAPAVDERAAASVEAPALAAAPQRAEVAGAPVSPVRGGPAGAPVSPFRGGPAGAPVSPAREGLAGSPVSPVREEPALSPAAAAPAAPRVAEDAPASSKPPEAPARAAPQATPFDNHRLLPVPRFRDLRVIGQLADTYVLCEGGGELVIIDQHAAHERVTLYKLMRDQSGALGGTQRLLTPILVDLPAARARLLGAQLDAVTRHGLDVSWLGGSTFAIQGVPAALRHADLPRLLADVADDLAEGGRGAGPDAILEQVLSTMACHTSVRAGQSLDERAMRELLRALDEVDFSVCAHGRPVAIRVSPGELERRFHRA